VSIFSNPIWYGGRVASTPIWYNFSSDIIVSSTNLGQINELFNKISSVTDITFTKQSLWVDTWISKNTGSLSFPSNRSYAKYPDSGADIYLSNSHFNGNNLADHSPGSWNYVDFLHEVMHTLGLEHIHEGDNE